MQDESDRKPIEILGLPKGAKIANIFELPKDFSFITQRTGVLNREVDTKECWWLSNNLPKGLAVFETPDSFGLSSGGPTVCLEPNGKKVIEVPENSVTWD